MDRALTSAYVDAITKKLVPVLFFAEFEFSSGTLRMWSGRGNTTWLSRTWIGAGHLAGITPVDETTETGSANLTFTLSGIPSSLLSLALADPYRGRPCRLWLVPLDDAGAPIDGYMAFGGRMDVMKIDDAGDTASISLQCESRMIDLGRARDSRYTDAEQQRLYPGDRGCQYTAVLAEQAIPWGVPPSNPVTTPSYGEMRGVLL